MSVTAETIHEAMAHLARLTRKVDAIDALASADVDREFQRIQAWRAAELGDVPDEIERTRTAIEQMVAEYVTGRKTKSVSTPWGTATTRTATKWEWTDVAEKWAEEHAPELIVTPPPTQPPARLDKNALKALATVLADGSVLLDGEIVDGVTARTQTAVTIALGRTDPAAGTNTEGDPT